MREAGPGGAERERAERERAERERADRLARALADAARRERARARDLDVDVLLRRVAERAAARRRRLLGASAGAAAVLALLAGPALPRPGADGAAEGPAPQDATRAHRAWPVEGGSPLLPNRQVADLLPGVVPLSHPVVLTGSATTVGGLCSDDAISTVDPLLHEHRRVWAARTSAGGVPERVQQRVLVFTERAAGEYVAMVRLGSSTCRDGSPRSAPWRFDAARHYPGQDVAVAFSPSAGAVRTSVVMRRGPVVVELRTTVSGDLRRAREVTGALAAQALLRATTTAERASPTAGGPAAPGPRPGEDSPLLPRQQVAAVLPGLRSVAGPTAEAAGAPTPGGLCTEEPIPTVGPLVRGHRRAWVEVPTAGPAPRDLLQERVRTFGGDGAAEYFAGVVSSTAPCLSGTAGSRAWAFDDLREYPGEDVLAAWVPESDGFDAFSTSAVLREGAVVVELRLTVRGELGHALDVTRALARQALAHALAAERGR